MNVGRNSFNSAFVVASMFILLLGCSSVSTHDPDEALELFYAGNSQLESGEPQAAVETYTLAVRKDPGLARAFNNRGLARAMLGDLEGAVNDYNAAMERGARFAETHYNRAVAHHHLRNFDQAILDYSEALRLQEAYPEAYAGRGLARAAAGDPTSAAQDFKKALDRAPEDWKERKAIERELEKALAAAKPK